VHPEALLSCQKIAAIRSSSKLLQQSGPLTADEDAEQKSSQVVLYSTEATIASRRNLTALRYIFRAAKTKSLCSTRQEKSGGESGRGFYVKN